MLIIENEYRILEQTINKKLKDKNKYLEIQLEWFKHIFIDWWEVSGTLGVLTNNIKEL